MRGNSIRIGSFFLILVFFAAPPAQASREALTIPVILADYYGFAYTQAYQDRSFGFFYSAAGVDALGWGIVAAKRRYSGMFLVNFAGVAKTVYPLVILGGKPDREIKRRAWVSVGTHAGTLIWLRVWGKPGLAVTSWMPDKGGTGAHLAWAF
jgi:hypothetical protein